MRGSWGSIWLWPSLPPDEMARCAAPRLCRHGRKAISSATISSTFPRNRCPTAASTIRPVPSRKPCLTAVLRMAGLRPTRQRVALAELLFGGAAPARQRRAAARRSQCRQRVNVSLATIYNTLHQFREAGLLREVAVDASRSYFDTDTSDHHHFYLEDEQRVIDIPSSAIVIQNLPEPPKGTNITHVDVVVRVRRQQLAARLPSRTGLSRIPRPCNTPQLALAAGMPEWCAAPPLCRMGGGADLAPGAVAAGDLDAETGAELGAHAAVGVASRTERNLFALAPGRDEPGALARQQVLVHPAFRAVDIANLPPGVEFLDDLDRGAGLHIDPGDAYLVPGPTRTLMGVERVVAKRGSGRPLGPSAAIAAPAQSIWTSSRRTSSSDRRAAAACRRNGRPAGVAGMKDSKHDFAGFGFFSITRQKTLMVAERRPVDATAGQKSSSRAACLPPSRRAWRRCSSRRSIPAMRRSRRDELVAGLDGKDVLVSSINDRIDADLIARLPQERQAHRPVRQRLRQHRHRRRLRGGADRHQHAQRAHRGHRRHGGDADAGAAAAAGGGRRGAAARRRPGRAGRRPGCWGGGCAARRWASSAWAASAPRWPAGRATFGLNIHYFSRNRRPPAIEEPLDATYWPSLDDDGAGGRHRLAAHAASPATPTTFSTRRGSRRMRQDAFVVNVSRPELIDEEALVAGIESGHLSGAALDVFENRKGINPAAAGAGARPQGGAHRAHGLGDAGEPDRDGRDGDRQHPGLHRRPPAAAPGAARGTRQAGARLGRRLH